MTSPSQQFSHSPAPWVADEQGSIYQGDVSGDLIAQVFDNPDSGLDPIDHEQSDYNLLLITAAPALLAFAQWAESRQPEMLKKIEANKFVFNDIGNEPGNWQHLAFTLYTELCALNEMARPVIAKATKGES